MSELKTHSFCLIRHGETVANRDSIIAGRLDVSLTDLGREQAKALQNLQWPVGITLYCSPKERAMETCALAFPDRTAELCDGLAERDWGRFEGRPLAELPIREDTPEGGESWGAFLERVGKALVHCCEASNGVLPVMVCHSGVIRAARILTGQRSVGWRPANALPIHFGWDGQQHNEELFFA